MREEKDMSTKSLIYREVSEGKYEGIYCHWDGYIEHNGMLLYIFYNTEAKVKELIDLGFLSELGAKIGTKVDFQKRVEDEAYFNETFNQCVAYHRDKGEKKEILYKLDTDAHYIYIFKKGKWFVSKGKKFVPLEDEIAALLNEMQKESYADLVKNLGANMPKEADKKIKDTLTKLVKKREAQPDYIIEGKTENTYRILKTYTNERFTITETDLEIKIKKENPRVMKRYGNTLRNFTLK